MPTILQTAGKEHDFNRDPRRGNWSFLNRCRRCGCFESFADIASCQLQKGRLAEHIAEADREADRDYAHNPSDSRV